MPTLIDSYNESNVDALYPINNTSFNGQTFSVSVDCLLDSFKFYLYRYGNPTGNIMVFIYDHTGTYGVDGKPSNSIILASSDPIDVSTIGTSPYLVNFSVTQYDGYYKIPLYAGTKYCLMLYSDAEYIGGATILAGVDSSSPTHGGNFITSYDLNTFTPNNSVDMSFYIYGTLFKTNTLICNITLSSNKINYIKNILLSSITLFSTEIKKINNILLSSFNINSLKLNNIYKILSSSLSLSTSKIVNKISSYLKSVSLTLSSSINKNIYLRRMFFGNITLLSSFSKIKNRFKTSFIYISNLILTSSKIVKINNILNSTINLTASKFKSIFNNLAVSFSFVTFFAHMRVKEMISTIYLSISISEYIDKLKYRLIKILPKIDFKANKKPKIYN